MRGPGRLFGPGGCRRLSATRGCSGSKDRDGQRRLEAAGPANRGPAIASSADWLLFQPRPAPPRPLRGVSKLRCLRPGLGAPRPESRASGRSPRFGPAAGGGGWGNRLGIGVRKEKLSNWSEDPSSTLPIPHRSWNYLESSFLFPFHPSQPLLPLKSKAQFDYKY